MKITFLSVSLNMGGGIKVMAIYAQYLIKQGHEVNIVSTPMQSKPTLFARLKNALRFKFFYPTTQKSHFDGLNINNHVIDAYRPIVDADVPDADIVIATWWETAEWLKNLSARKGKKVYFIQGHEVFDFIPKQRSIATYQSDAHKIVVSKWLKDTLTREYQSSNLALVPNAIDHSLFYAAERRKNAVPTIGFLANNGHTKGLDIALDVVEKLKKDYPQLRVVTFGSSKLKNVPFKALSITFNLLPVPEKIREIYTECDVWLAPSRSEGFNLTAMEAMACGTPVVSTKTGWPVESIDNFKNGILTEIDDVNALTNGVKWFLEQSDATWKKCSEHAVAATADYSWEKSAAQFESALLTLHNKRQAN